MKKRVKELVAIASALEMAKYVGVSYTRFDVPELIDIAVYLIACRFIASGYSVEAMFARGEQLILEHGDSQFRKDWLESPKGGAQ